MTWIDDRLNEYYTWMRDNTVIKEAPLSGWFSISTPFVGLFNDHIEIFVKKDGEKILLSDDGETLANLSLCGVDVNGSPKRKAILDSVLKNHGIKKDHNELTVVADSKSFPRAKHNLVSAIAEISDMEFMSSHSVASMFKEDVYKYLKERQINFTPQFLAKGSTGLEFTFDFHISGFDSELVIKSFNNLTKDSIINFLFSWGDIRPQREAESRKKLRGLALINDSDASPKQDLLDAFKSRDADVLLWSERHNPQSIELLSAS